MAYHMSKVLMAWSLWFVQLHTATPACPQPVCRCSSSVYVTCGIGYKDNFPMFTDLASGDTLTISGNRNITRLPDSPFRGLDFYHFTLEDTSISELNCTVFDGISRVDDVDLKNNALKSVPTCALKRLNSGSFTQLTLDGNDLTTLMTSELAHFSGLQHLSVKDNLIATLDLSRLNIRNLYLQRNSVTSLSATAFSGMVNLYRIVLSNNKITGINNATFSSQSRLQYLDLSGNQIVDLSNGFLLPLAGLISLDLSDNKISEIKNGTFGTTQVETLDLSGNLISSLTPGCFPNLRRLENLKLKRNIIMSYSYGTFDRLCGLLSLDLAFNKLRTISPIWTSRTCRNHISSIDFEGNEISRIEKSAFDNLESLRILNLRGNKLSVIGDDYFFGASVLHTLYLQKNQINSIETTGFRGVSALRSLYLSNNNLERITMNDFDELEDLRFLDLSFNKISIIDPLAFKDNDFLRTLDLSNNRLTRQSLPSLGLSLGNIPVVENLQLSGNPLQSLSENIFRFATHLRTLGLSDCQLEYLPLNQLKDLPKIVYLDISKNKFTDSEENQPLTVRTASSSLNLNISHNMLSSLHLNASNSLSTFYLDVDASSNRLQHMSIIVSSSSNVCVRSQLKKNQLSQPVRVKVGKRVRQLGILSADLSENRLGAVGSFPIQIETVNGTNASLWNPCQAATFGSVQVSAGSLNLAQNNIEEYNPTMCLGMVNTLILDRNVIKLSSLDFNGTQCSLTSLSLKSNAIDKIPAGFLNTTCPYLGSLNIEDNALTNIDSLMSLMIRTSFRSLKLAGNSIDCNCSLLWMKQAPLLNVVDTGRCQTPSSARGYKLTCFPDSHCAVPQTYVNTSSYNSCKYDYYVAVTSLGLQQPSDDSLGVNWKSYGPGDVDHYVISSHEVDTNVSASKIVNWQLSSVILTSVQPNDYRYNVCGAAGGPRVSKASLMQCIIYDRASEIRRRNLAIGLSIGISAVVIVVIVLIILKVKGKLTLCKSPKVE